MSIQHYMNWVGGVDFVAMTPGSESPNIIVHVAEMVTTPVGSAPAGMILLQLESTQPPLAMGFISSNIKVAEYFGPNIFKDTPFENAPAFLADIDIKSADGTVTACIKAGDLEVTTKLSGLEALELHQRTATAHTPFHQSCLESVATTAELEVNGQTVDFILPPVGISGGAPAVSSPAGFYSVGN